MSKEFPTMSWKDFLKKSGMTQEQLKASELERQRGEFLSKWRKGDK